MVVFGVVVFGVLNEYEPKKAFTVNKNYDNKSMTRGPNQSNERMIIPILSPVTAVGMVVVLGYDDGGGFSK